MNRPPSARVETVRDDYFGAIIEDPYRWMEGEDGEACREFIAEQGDYARRYLDGLPDRDALLARISELSAGSPQVLDVQMAGGRAFYLRRDPQDRVPKLAVRITPDAEERVLVDPNTLPGELHSAIDWYKASPDGRLVVYAISEAGSEDSTLHVVEVETGEMLPDAISRTPFLAPAWRADGRSFYYTRLADRLPTAVDRFLDARVYLHHLGDDPENDQVIFGREVNPSVDMVREDIPQAVTTTESEWVLGIVYHGDLSDMSLYAVRPGDLDDPAGCRWTRVCSIEDAIKAGIVQWRGDDVYLLTHKDAPRYQVVSTQLTNPDMATGKVVVPAGERVIEGMLLVEDALVTQEVDAGVDRLWKTPLAGGQPTDIPLPVDGSIGSWAHEPGESTILLTLQTYVSPPQIYRLDITTDVCVNTGWIPPSAVDLSDLVVTRTFAPAPDGVRIPLTIIHRGGLARDGRNPAILHGYGSYGIRFPMIFLPQLLAWYERGGILAIAGLRGGGEYGHEWHEAGYMMNKQNTIDDFIAAAEYLVRERYTSPGLLAGEGGSAGGIPTGGALVRRPDLFAAMIMHVPVTDALRVQFSPNGVPNMAEFGDVTTPEGFQALQIISSYHKIRDGVPYPAVMLTTGLNDPRVAPWQPAKMAARLQAATSSGKPVLLRVEAQAGHGVGSTREQMDAELADVMAFLLAQFNLSGAGEPKLAAAKR